ncbi:MAG: DUF4412 domain-containing protein [Aureispira sp.]|nr:DUF4412 domain-containing protein [Aureispira sp.]
MLKSIFVYIIAMCVYVGATAQDFEGIIEMTQETANGLKYDLKWFIKKDQIAYEISSTSARSAQTQLRFVPQPKKNTMLMITHSDQGDNKSEIATTDITAPPGFNFDDVTIEEGEESSSDDFKKIQQLVVKNEKLSTEVDVTSDININFKEYAAYFKADYGIYALVKSGKKGFPLNSVTKDALGNILSKTTLKSVKRMKVSDKYFQ